MCFLSSLPDRGRRKEKREKRKVLESVSNEASKMESDSLLQFIPVI